MPVSPRPFSVGRPHRDPITQPIQLRVPRRLFPAAGQPVNLSRGDLFPLAGLISLRSLDLTNCRRLTGDLSPLANLTSLRWLNLAWCDQISDLSPLAGLTSLQSLNLALCGLRRFAPLQSLLPTLKVLSLFGCKFDDLPQEVCGEYWNANALGVSPTKVRKVPQDFCQQSGRKGFSPIPELPRRDLF